MRCPHWLRLRRVWSHCWVFRFTCTQFTVLCISNSILITSPCCCCVLSIGGHLNFENSGCFKQVPSISTETALHSLNHIDSLKGSLEVVASISTLDNPRNFGFFACIKETSVVSLAAHILVLMAEELALICNLYHLRKGIGSENYIVNCFLVTLRKPVDICLTDAALAIEVPFASISAKAV